MNEEECCPRLDVAQWDRKEMEWQDKPFLRTKYRTIFHIPINFDSVVTKAMGQISSRGLTEELTLMLSREESAFSSTLLISLREAPGSPRRPGDLPVERLSGKYVSRLFEGGYQEVSKWIKKVRRYCQQEGKEATELLFWYATCPKCAKKYGTAQTVIFAKIA